MNANAYENFTSQPNFCTSEVLIRLYNDLDERSKRSDSCCFFFILDLSKYEGIYLNNIDETRYLILACHCTKKANTYHLILLRVDSLSKREKRLRIMLPKTENPGRWILKNGKGVNAMKQTIKKATGIKVPYIYITN